MIKLKQLIKEETIHSCECGGDCCSVNESTDINLPDLLLSDCRIAAEDQP